MKQYILYNPLSGNGDAKNDAEIISQFSDIEFDDSILVDITSINNYTELSIDIAANDRIVICGGDGTLNRFINSAGVDTIPCDIYYMATGTGNDFLRDIAPCDNDNPVNITVYLKDLPEVAVNGTTYKFLNNVGFGIDGYCTEMGDKMRAAHKEKINYTSIAIMGLLGKFHSVSAKITVDGLTKEYEDVWLAPTMNGRFYGGGMMPTPNQNRLNERHTVSIMVFHAKSRLKTLCVFPSIFTGRHIKHSDMVEVLVGENISVEFDCTTPLQIDGETIKNVLKYEVHVCSKEYAYEHF